MNYRTLALAAAFAAGTIVSGQAMASHHFESSLVRKEKSLNQLDNYVFQSDRPDHTVFIMSFNPLPKAGQELYSTDALYNIHVSNDADYQTGHTFSFRYDSNGNYQVYMLDAPNADAGAMGDKIGEGHVDKALKLDNGIKIWTGIIKDPFYGNSPSLGSMRAQLNDGTPYDPGIWAAAGGKSIFTGRKQATIVLDVPNSLLSKEIRVFMTTAIKQGDGWEQVQFSANPLVSHTMLFENDALKTAYDKTRPTTSGSFKNIMAARIARASELANSRAEPIRYGNEIADLLVPDVLTYAPGTKATYSVEKRNGRPLADDAMSVILSLMVGLPVDQKIPNPKLYKSSFPYIIPTTVN
ncbi:DUF4331 family protein [Pseudoxanthomonas dokdonensis]|uniref:DUF4331 domain-containing protein n=1 Tax=Pseudoxanthomonas dokdonensis TaxID=344882 RepID=A0A0R0CZ40_9GAMM|nr:DUF4331 family protein [Pseudoxanthomonas dokdonensis]KRG71690.1 hypothetical protein ABB29_02835 [Pseudoxanthomonas dokdonensis]